MTNWKLAFFISIIALLFSNTFWLYTTIDHGISYGYQNDSLREQIKNSEILGSLIIKGSQQYLKKDILYILRKQNKNAFIVEEENIIIINTIRFIFKNNKLVKITN